MEATAFLALYLDAPLQSWGYQSRFDRRTSLSYPTRSGITGMICAAMGIPKNDAKFLAQLNKLACTVYSLKIHQRMTDFHTVGGGYNRSTQKQFICRTADNKVSSTVITRREYLQDAKFGVVISGGRDLIENIHQALCNPKWGIWFGRKSCIPAMPVSHGYFETHEDALKAIIAILEDIGSVMRKIYEVSAFNDGSDTIMDMPTDFQTRIFLPRRINVE